MTTLSRRLRPELQTALRRLQEHPRAQRVLDGTASAEQLAQFYVTAAETVQHASTFLHGSAETLRRHGGHPALIALFERKGSEENGHDRWLRDDLEAIGYGPKGSTALRPAPAAGLYNSFHRGVTGLSGEAFLGTAWVLESLSVQCASAAAENLRCRAGIKGISQQSNAGLTFLTSHADADVSHVTQLEEVLDRYVPSSLAQDYVLLTARFTATLYADFFTAP